MRTQADLAARAGIGKRTVSDLERGSRRNFSADTLAAVEAALGWAPGAVARVLAGEPIAREGDVDLARLEVLWATLGQRERRVLLAVAEVLAEQA